MFSQLRQGLCVTERISLLVAHSMTKDTTVIKYALSSWAFYFLKYVVLFYNASEFFLDSYLRFVALLFFLFIECRIVVLLY